MAESTEKKSEVVDDPELEALLDEALEEFGKPPPLVRGKKGDFCRSGTQADEIGDGSDALAAALGLGKFAQGDEMNNVWTEEFIKEATTQFENKMRQCLLQNQNQSTPSPSSSKDKEGSSRESSQLPTSNMGKIIEAATKAALEEATQPNLNSQFDEALKNFAFPQNLQNGLGGDGALSEEELSRLMSALEVEEDSEIDQILPFMTNFMEKLLSKDLLYPVLTDIVQRYPDWLSANREKLSEDEFDKYSRQYEYMKEICGEYSADSESDSEQIKRQRFDKISQLMLKVQCCGTPPKELVGDEGNMTGFDQSALLSGLQGFQSSGQCSIS